jgi:hypothetical protein
VSEPKSSGHIALPGERVDADLLEQVGHAERARLVRDDRHDARPQLAVLQQVAEQAHERHRRRHLLAGRADGELRPRLERRHGDARASRAALRQIAAERPAPRVQVRHLLAVVGRLVEGKVDRLPVADRQVEAVAELMGIGPISSIYHARFMRYLTHRGLLDCGARKVWGVFGDGEMDEPESMSALTLASREGLDNLVWVVNPQPASARRPGAQQRQDRRRARAAVPRRRLARHQAAVGQ